MKTSVLRALFVVTIAALSLSACTSAPTPQPTGGPAMSVDEASAYYLDTVCPANAVGEALSTAYAAADLAAFTAAADTARDAYKTSAARFGDEAVVWPADVAADVIILRDTSIVLAASYESLSEITTLDDANTVSFPDSAEAASASQRIRDALNLSADADESCG